MEPQRVWLSRDTSTYSVDNDQVFVFAGGEVPTRFLHACGVQIETRFGTA